METSVQTPKDQKSHHHRHEAIWPDVNHGFPALSVSNPTTFGRITSSLGDPREMQMAVKFYF